MEGEGRRKQVNYEQLVALLEFLKEHEDLAKGLTRGRHRRGKFHIVKAWNLCSKKLNGLKDGAVKDGKGWSKYWCDWKYRAKRRALELKAAKDGDKPLPEGMLPLSAMEEDILNLIGQSAVEDVVIMNDPLSEEGLDEAIQNYTDNNEDSPINQYFESEDGEPLTKSRKRRQPCHDDDEAGPSSPLERKPTLETTTSGSKKNSKVEKRSSKRRRKERSPINSDMEMGGSCSPLERKPEVVAKKNGTDCVDSDVEDKASAFLSIEREKVFSTGKIINTLQMIHTEISRLTSVMADIKDYLVTNYRQISVT